MNSFNATYKDKRGIEKIVILSDGSNLKTTIRGITFEGSDFEMLDAETIDKDKFDYNFYTDVGQKTNLSENISAELTNFELEIRLPLKFIVKEEEITMILVAKVSTGKEIGGSNVDLYLNADFGEFRSSKKFGWFEDAIIDLQKQLPERIKIKSCLSCKFSHYHPGGNGMFGHLHCFKKVKSIIPEINDKFDLMHIWKKHLEYHFDVQETHECSEYESITDNDWVYKNWTNYYLGKLY